MEYDMEVLHFIGITIDEDIDTAPYNFPEQKQQLQGQEQQGGEVWK